MSPNHPAFSRKINLLLEDRDLNGLVMLLRSPDQPDLRSQAASALGELGDVDATESLARSTLEDPDTIVQAAARRALEQLLGNQAQLVINSYRTGPPESEPWLVEPYAEEDEEDDDEDEDESGEDIDEAFISKTRQPISARKIDQLLEDRDLNGLVAVLRTPALPDLRAKAALALGNLGDVDATESLVRSTVQDPDAAVQTAARQALEQLHGNRAQLVINSYPPESLDSEPWLAEPNDDEELGETDEEAEWLAENDSLDLDGLMRIASHESNLSLRLKAIHMLAFSKDMRATDILAYLALRDTSKNIRAAALSSLQERHSDQAEEILKNYQNDLQPSSDEDDEFEDELDSQDSGDETELEEDEELDVETVPSDREAQDEQAENAGYDRIPISPSEFPKISEYSTQNSGVVEEASFPWQSVLLIGLVILIVVVVVLLLIGKL